MEPVTNDTKFDPERHYEVQLSESVIYGNHPLAAGKQTALRGDVAEELRSKIATYKLLPAN